MFRKNFASLAALILAIAWTCSGKAEAQLRPSALVLLPYFEVDLGSSGKTTIFAVGNALDQTVDIQIEVRTNWGVTILGVPAKLAAHEVKTFNLRDWIVQGKLPGKTLKQAEKAQLKAALSGQKAPDNLYYSTTVAPNLAVGSVIIRAGGSMPQALWGDFLLVDPAFNISMGDDLVNLERASCGSWLCNRHALRFLSGASINLDTEVIIWTDRSGSPSKTSYPESQKVGAEGIAYNEAGQPIGNPGLRLLPLQVVSVASLGLKEPFGWIDLRTEEPTFIGLHFDTLRKDGAALQAYCLKDDPHPPGSGLELVKRTNGEDANDGPGPTIAVGSPVVWEYTVRNTGGVRLTKVKVTDDDASLQVSCPKDTLEAGETMFCTAKGTAVACQYQNIGTAVGTQPNGTLLEADDPSHYFGGQNARIDVELAVNQQDADQPAGAAVEAGDPLQWTYLVTNTGDVLLTDVKVTDDTGVVPSCPKTSLRPGESMTCTASGTAVAGQHRNVGAAAAKGPCGDDAKDSDPTYYNGLPIEPPPPASIAIKKYTNGYDADTAPGPHIKVGEPVQWTYTVTNNGGVNLTDVQVADSRGVAVSCPKTSLQKGEAMTCTGSGKATVGQYENIGTATGKSPNGSSVTDSDPSHYFGQDMPSPCGIKIKKYTNGQDADAAPGPTIPVGNAVQWTYVVTNPGQVVLSNVKVTDNKGVAVSCPKTSLQPAEAMTCTGSGTATAGQYENIGTAVGTPPSGPNATDSDPSHYYGQVLHADVKIKKYTNGQDADAAPGPTIPVGNAVQWTYTVTNIGEVALSNVQVTDNKGVAVSCPKTSLQVGESMTCTGNGTATAGQYENIGTVAGTPPSGSNVTASDPSHYFGQIPTGGGQGCTPGYWKNHTDSWPPTGYSPSQKVQNVFGQAAGYPSLGNASLLDALSFQGGSTLEGAAGNLLRASVAALLDSSHPGVDYPRTPASVISDVNAALASGNRDTILGLASQLDADNNRGCPLN